MIKSANSIYRDHQIYLFAILTSILLSLLLAYRNSVINPDGICYVMGAELLGSSSIKDVMNLCPQAQWPFYSALIYGLSLISDLSYNVSAHLLNGAFSLISVVMFIKIVEIAGANQRELMLAALVILFAHQFNLLRDNIIRDHGFWAFYLISIYLLLNYFNHPRWMMALLWSASLMLATLFRIEGSIFLIAMPFITWFYFHQSWLNRLKIFLMLNFPVLLMGVFFILWQFPHHDQIMHSLGRMGEVIHQFQNGSGILIQRFDAIRAAMIQYILPAESLPDASVIVLLVWVGWYLYNVMLTLSFAYTVLILYALKNRVLKFSANHAPVVLGYIAINLVMTMGFIAETLFISKRYLVALTLVLMIWVPFAFNDLINKWSSLRHRLLLIVLTILFAASAISSVVEFGRSKFYIRTAGSWMADNIPASAAVYVNDFQLMYYSRHFGFHIFEKLPAYLQINNVVQGKWKQYDYLALRLRKHGNDQASLLLNELTAMAPMKIFSDRHGNRVAIYKLHQKSNRIMGEKK